LCHPGPDDDVILYDGVCVFLLALGPSSQFATRSAVFSLYRYPVRVAHAAGLGPFASIRTTRHQCGSSHGGEVFFNPTPRCVLSHLP